MLIKGLGRAIGKSAAISTADLCSGMPGTVLSIQSCNEAVVAFLASSFRMLNELFRHSFTQMFPVTGVICASCRSMRGSSNMLSRLLPMAQLSPHIAIIHFAHQGSLTLIVGHLSAARMLLLLQNPSGLMLIVGHLSTARMLVLLGTSDPWKSH